MEGSRYHSLFLPGYALEFVLWERIGSERVSLPSHGPKEF